MDFREKLASNSCPLALAGGFSATHIAPVVHAGLGLIGGMVLLGSCLLLVWRHWRERFLVLGPQWQRAFGYFLLGLGLGLVSLFAYARLENAQSLGIEPQSIIQVEGVLLTDALHSRDGWRAQIRVTQARDCRGIAAATNQVCLAYFDTSQALYAGCRLSLTNVRLKAVTGRAYAWQLSGSIVELDPGQGLERWRSRLLAGCEAALGRFSPGLRGFIMALLFGRQDELDPDMQQAFYRSGCAHLVALSGMHIALVAALLVRLLRPVIGIVGARVGGFLGAAGFIWLAGPFPSALRALVMFGLLQLGAWLGRRFSGIGALCLSGPILGLINPALPLSLGFQLSFWALFGIMIWQESLHGLLRRPLLPVVSLEVSGGISAQACTAPLLWSRGLPFFPQGIVAGIALAPLVLVFMALAAMALILGLALGPGGNAWMEWPLQLFYGLILQIGGFFAA